MKYLTISNAADTGVNTTTIITGSLSIPPFASGWALPIGMALSGIRILLPLTNADSQKPSQLFAVKQEKHNSIKLLAQTKLDSISMLYHKQSKKKIFCLLNS